MFVADLLSTIAVCHLRASPVLNELAVILEQTCYSTGWKGESISKNSPRINNDGARPNI